MKTIFDNSNSKLVGPGLTESHSPIGSTSNPTILSLVPVKIGSSIVDSIW